MYIFINSSTTGDSFNDIPHLRNTHEWSYKYDEVDFTVYPVIDRYLQNNKDREAIIEMMEKLLNRIKNNEYPFKV